MTFIKSILFHLKTNILGFSARVLGVLLIVDLLAISAKAQTKTNQINLTNNDLTTQEKISALDSEGAFSHEAPEIFNFSHKANDLSPEHFVTPSFYLISDLYAQTDSPTNTKQRKLSDHQDRPLHRDPSQPGQSIAEQATDPSAILGQLQFQNVFTPSTYDADGYANTFIMQPVIPFKGGKVLPASVSRLTWSAIVTTPDRETGIPGEVISGTTNVGDVTWIHVWINKVGKDFRIGAGPAAVFPAAGDDRTGAGKWQLGPSFLVIYSGIPHLTLGVFAQSTFSFAGDSDRPDIAPLNFQGILVYHFPKGWYAGWGDQFITTDLRTEDFNIPLSLRVGKVFKIGSQAINMFVQPTYTPESFQSGGESEWGIKLNATFILPKLLL